jgi:hypothetical protein
VARLLLTSLSLHVADRPRARRCFSNRAKKLMQTQANARSCGNTVGFGISRMVQHSVNDRDKKLGSSPNHQDVPTYKDCAGAKPVCRAGEKLSSGIAPSIIDSIFRLLGAHGAGGIFFAGAIFFCVLRAVPPPARGHDAITEPNLGRSWPQVATGKLVTF